MKITDKMQNPHSSETLSGASRRGFLKTLTGIGAGLAALPATGSAQGARPSGAKYMGGFAAPKLDKVKLAIIGVGARGSGHASQLAVIEGVEFVGICDVVESRALVFRPLSPRPRVFIVTLVSVLLWFPVIPPPSTP